MGRKINFNEETVISMLKMRENGYSNKKIAEKYNISPGFAGTVFLYYDGKKVHKDTLGRYSKKVIDNVKENKIPERVYECKLFFGLITLKIEPIRFYKIK
jgi:hypothetical protein